VLRSWRGRAREGVGVVGRRFLGLGILGWGDGLLCFFGIFGCFVDLGIFALSTILDALLRAVGNFWYA